MEGGGKITLTPPMPRWRRAELMKVLLPLLTQPTTKTSLPFLKLSISNIVLFTFCPLTDDTTCT